MNEFEILETAGKVAFGGAIAAAGLALFYKVLGALGGFVLRYFFVGKNVSDEFTTSIVVNYLKASGRHWGVNDERYDAARHYVRPAEKDIVVFFRKMAGSFRLFLHKGKPILLMPGRYVEGGRGSTHEAGCFRFLRWTVNWEELLEKAGRHYDSAYEKNNNTGSRKRFAIIRYSGETGGSGSVEDSDAPKSPGHAVFNLGNIGDLEPLHWKLEELGAPSPEEPLNHLSLGKEAAKVVRDVKFWHSHRDWYRERSVPWRRGYSLFGRPGTGKTSLVRALGEELDIPLHVFDLSSMDNNEFANAWKQAHQAAAPRIVLFEDFDAVFQGRKNKREDDWALSFDCLLNHIDGVERQDGTLLFVTTNHIEDIDPALGIPDKDGISTRPGRIDAAVELPGLDLAGRRKMAKRILQDDIEAEKLALAHDGDTAAQFQERCVQLALKQLWGDAALDEGLDSAARALEG